MILNGLESPLGSLVIKTFVAFVAINLEMMIIMIIMMFLRVMNDPNKMT